MTKYSVITIEEARKYYPNVKVSEFICFENYGDDPVQPDYPFGLGASPEGALENGCGLNSHHNPGKNTRYYYRIVVPDKTESYPPAYADFSTVFFESDDLPSDFAKEHYLTMVYSGKGRNWRATYSNKKSVLQHLAEEGDLENSLIIDDEIEDINGFPLAKVPSSFSVIDEIRRWSKVTKEQASRVLGEKPGFWEELRCGNQTMTICQWNIFLQAIDQHLEKQFRDF